MLSIVILLPFLLSAANPWSQRMIESHGLGDFYCNRSHMDSLKSAGWDYVSGLVANSVLKAWEQYPEKTEYYNAVKAFADRNTSNDGNIILNASGGSALGQNNLDDLAAGKVFFALYREELKKGNVAESDRFKNAATLIRNKLKYQHDRIAEGLPGAGGFYHKSAYPSQMWLDGLYMGPAVYAQWQDVFGKESDADNQESWSDIANQFKIIDKYTYNPDEQLYYHAWSAIPGDENSFWANQTGSYIGCSKEFWGRGMGWYFAALADVLEVMPKDHKDYSSLLAIYNKVAAGLKRWQDNESGVWYQLLQYDGTKTGDGKGDLVNGYYYNIGTTANYLESSCSCMFTYAFLKGVRLGLIDKETYLPVAIKAFDGIKKNFIVESSNGIDIVKSCASAGLGPASNPSRTGSSNYYLCGKDVGIATNEGKAIGTFIMASLEYERQVADTSITDACIGKYASDSICCFSVPSDGIYMIRLQYEGETAATFKQSCKAGINTLKVRSYGKKGDIEIFSGKGTLVSRLTI